MRSTALLSPLVALLLSGCSSGSDAGGGSRDHQPPGPPAIACDTLSLDFETVHRGNSRTLSVRCRNTGGGRWTLGAAPHERVTVAIQPEGPVDVGESWELALTWTAGRAGEWRTPLTLLADGERVVSLGLRGNAVGACLHFRLTEGPSFGLVAPGHSSTRRFELTNACPEPSVVLSAAAKPDAPPGFSFATATPFEVPPAHDGVVGRASLVAVFSPAPDHMGGRVSAQLLVTTDDPGFAPQTIFADAFVGGPAISCSPSTLDLGVTVPDLPVTATLTCTNVGRDVPWGDEDLLVIEAPVTSSAEFSAVVRGGPGSYAVGEEFVIDVTYLPVDDGLDAATLWIHSNAYNTRPDAPAALALAGQGFDFPPCEFELAPEELRWGIVQPGDAQTLEFAIRNLRADAACLVRDLRLAPTTDPAFSLGFTPPPVLVLDAGAELRVPIVFAPPAHRETHFLGDVLFSLSDPADPHQVVRLLGTSTATCLRPHPAAIEFGAFRPGCASRDREVVLVNDCAETVYFAGAEIGPGADVEGVFFVRTEPPAHTPVAPGASVVATFAYRPFREGPSLGRAFVFEEGEPQPIGIALAGEADLAARTTDTWTSRPWTGTCYFLGNQPDLDAGPLVVRVDGKEVEPVDESGTVWTYDRSQVAVCFDSARLPPDGALVEISYLTACLSW